MRLFNLSLAVVIMVLVVLLVFMLPAKAQTAGPWHIITTQCFGTITSAPSNNAFQLDLQGNPNISVDQTQQTTLDCVTGKWKAQTFAALSDCATEATALQQQYDAVNALGYFQHNANCWAPPDACQWILTIYQGAIPAEAQAYHDANCQTP